MGGGASRLGSRSCASFQEGFRVVVVVVRVFVYKDRHAPRRSCERLATSWRDHTKLHALPPETIIRSSLASRWSTSRALSYSSMRPLRSLRTGPALWPHATTETLRDTRLRCCALT